MTCGAKIGGTRAMATPGEAVLAVAQISRGRGSSRGGTPTDHQHHEHRVIAAGRCLRRMATPSQTERPADGRSTSQ